jgi:hypothetical protein
MRRFSKTSIRRNGETYFGIEIAPDGTLVVAERLNGKPARLSNFPAGERGARALRSHIEQEHAHAHVCIKACGAAALAVATALIPVQGIGVTIVAPRAFDKAPVSATPEENAKHLARLAERIF